MPEIKIAHSPDSDDAFMFYALANNVFDTGDLQFTHILKDIETLNKEALKGIYEVSAISIHAFPYVADKYILLPTGSSMGDRYGPMIVSKTELTRGQLAKTVIAVPGEMTTAFLALKIFNPDIAYRVVPFDQIIPKVLDGEFEAGLIIHEGQLTYARQGLNKIVDLGEWWFAETGLPLPLGGNVIRRDLGEPLMKRVSDFIQRSIQYSLDHRREALQYALKFAGDMDPELADRFVGMYVNHWTLDYGDVGRKAIRTLLNRGREIGIIKKEINVEFLT
ncbi:MAG TPA: ABC transporter substrate-binding protein [Caldithrix abyssi]|uniref:1,4-dihydroxy-6-naphtoate synthase n=1 Tax=Caldithrix abyssi TaxID=187145 RepID=A0A7V5PR35_CALAY|nr:ABC transporter substrate-binding protein [Caldithrix abyssi]